jgi:hypothetical protein
MQATTAKVYVYLVCRSFVGDYDTCLSIRHRRGVGISSHLHDYIRGFQHTAEKWSVEQKFQHKVIQEGFRAGEISVKYM